jgi:hypothetical protein
MRARGWFAVWHWITQTDAGLAVRVAMGIAILSMLAIGDLRRNGHNATRWREYLFLLLCVVAALVYGIVNDLITSTISWEYFCYGKELYPAVVHDLPPDPVKLHIAAMLIGMKATWTAGLIIGVALLVANNPRADRPQLAYGILSKMLLLIACAAILCACTMGIAGRFGWLAWISSDFAELVRMDAMRPARFIAVFGIHLGGYLGGITGTIAAVVATLSRRKRQAPAFQKVRDAHEPGIDTL